MIFSKGLNPARIIIPAVACLNENSRDGLSFLYQAQDPNILRLHCGSHSDHSWMSRPSRAARMDVQAITGGTTLGATEWFRSSCAKGRQEIADRLRPGGAVPNSPRSLASPGYPRWPAGRVPGCPLLAGPIDCAQADPFPAPRSTTMAGHTRSRREFLEIIGGAGAGAAGTLATLESARGYAANDTIEVGLHRHRRPLPDADEVAGRGPRRPDRRRLRHLRRRTSTQAQQARRSRRPSRPSAIASSSTARTSTPS